MKTQPPYTEEEDAIIAKYAGRIKSFEIVKKLQKNRRTIYSLRKQAGVLGISLKLGSMSKELRPGDIVMVEFFRYKISKNNRVLREDSQGDFILSTITVAELRRMIRKSEV